MDNEMIERCRIAVIEVVQNSNLPVGIYINSEAISLAVIKALREPTEKMNVVGTEEWPNHYKVWTKMIDSIVND